jgi:hypothetical protein
MERCTQSRPLKDHAWICCGPRFVSRVISARVAFSKGDSSGAGEFMQNYQKYEGGPNKGTSRNVYHCFSDTLSHIHDRHVGASPQIVGIDRRPNSPAITFGILHNGSRYFLGAKIDDLQNFDKVLWLNENFERCDGITMKKLPLAQSQPDPLATAVKEQLPGLLSEGEVLSGTGV